MPHLPGPSWQMQAAMMWKESPCKLIAIIISIILGVALVIFGFVYLIVVVKPGIQNGGAVASGGPGHAMELVTNTAHFLKLREHSWLINPR
jgi:hypothetical protein